MGHLSWLRGTMDVLGSALETTEHPLTRLAAELPIWTTKNPMGSFHPLVGLKLKDLLSSLNHAMANGLDYLDSALVEHLAPELVQALCSMDSHQAVALMCRLGYRTTYEEDQNVGGPLVDMVQERLDLQVDQLPSPPNDHTTSWIAAQG